MAGSYGNGSIVADSVAINYSSSGGVFVWGLGTGAANATALNDRIYGLYNYSVGYGQAAGNSYNVRWSNDQAYDVDASSVAYWVSTMTAKIVSADGGEYVLENNNGTGPATPAFVNPRTTDLNISSSSISSLILYGLKPTTYNVSRTVVPTDFNLTVYNSYVPSVFYQFNSATGIPTGPFSLFSFGKGSAYSESSGNNPYFLNLPGYLSRHL